MKKFGRFLFSAGVLLVFLGSAKAYGADTKVVIVPLGGAVGDATPEDVIAGKTFSSEAAGKGKVGTLQLPPAMQTYVTPDFGMTFNRLPAGTFTMGSWAGNPPFVPGELGRRGNETQHQVSLTKPFYMQVTEVTQKQWKEVVLAAENRGVIAIGVLDEEPSASHAGAYNEAYPVEAVSWENIKDWINALNQLTGQQYRLPTEAEWEYAARATTTTAWAYLYSYDTSPEGAVISGFNPNVDAMGWYVWNNALPDGYPSGTKPVAKKQPNKWGLYDMHGNVGEWCSDWYGAEYYSDPGSEVNPQGPESGSDRVLRGGGWGSAPRFVRAASRYGYAPDFAYDGLGFRLVLPVQQ